ncbi:hypothetical protein ABFX02_01G064300 [Erythranthe guttata]
MLSRAFVKPKRSPQAGESMLPSPASIFEYEDFIFGLLDDIPLISFNDNKNSNYYNNNSNSELAQMTLRQVLRASVGVIGESPLGMTEKMVLLGGKICAVKRFRRVAVRKREFGRRIERVAHVGNQCEYLVHVLAYLYAKRIKFVVCDYYPMGSLADLLSGAREQGHTALEWKHRFKIIQSIAKAISFIHSQNPPRDKNLQLNVHGNIKSSNVMVNIDFTARLSDYGFVQLADHLASTAADDDDTEQRAEPPIPPPPQPEQVLEMTLSRESDIYNFGVVLIEILGCPNINIVELKKVRKIDDRLFEFCRGRSEEKQASRVLDIALSCINSLSDARPTIQQILSCLGDI